MRMGCLYTKRISTPTSVTGRSKTSIKSKERLQFACPSYYIFAYQPNEYFSDADIDYNTSGVGWYLAIVVPALQNEVYVQINTYVSRDETARRFFNQYSEQIAQLIEEYDMEFHASGNSLFSEMNPTIHTDPEEISTLIENEGGEGRFKRFRIGWEVDTDQSPKDIVGDATKKIEELHEIFYNGVQRRTEYSEIA